MAAVDYRAVDGRVKYNGHAQTKAGAMAWGDEAHFYTPKSLPHTFTHVCMDSIRMRASYSAGLTEPRCVGRDRGVRESRKARACRLGAALAAHALLAGSFYAT